MRRIPALALLLAVLPVSAARAEAARRPFSLDDLARPRVNDPQRSPDGAGSPTPSTTDRRREGQARHRRLDGAWDGAQQSSSPRRPTASRARAGARTAATWPSSPRAATRTRRRRARRSGCSTAPAARPQKLTDLKGGVSDYAWSPDGTRLALVVARPDPDDDPEKKEGWKRKTDAADRHRPLPLQAGRRGLPRAPLHAPRALRRGGEEAEPLTTGPVDDEEPAWSPDGTRSPSSASARTPIPTAPTNTDLLVDRGAGRRDAARS